MKRFKTEVEFFRWFEHSGQIDHTQVSLQTLVTHWYTKEQVVDNITPPLEGLKIPYRKDILKASPFKKPIDKEPSSLSTREDINKILEQNNYPNKILHVVSKQIEETSSGLREPNFIRDKRSPSKSSPKIETHPIFKVPEFSRENFPKLCSEFGKSSDILEKKSMTSFLGSTSLEETNLVLCRRIGTPIKEIFILVPLFQTSSFRKTI